MASYARQARDDTMRKMADRIQARAIRRCGELLRQVPSAKGGDRRSTEGQAPVDSRTQVASDAGLSEHQRKTALRVAAVPEPAQRAEKANATQGRSSPADTNVSPFAQALSDTGVTRQQAHRYQALAEVPKETFDDAKDIADKAQALQTYARQANDPEMEIWVAEIWLRARRRVGELSAALETAPSGRAALSLPGAGTSKTEALEAAGLSKSEAHRCEQLAKGARSRIRDLHRHEAGRRQAGDGAKLQASCADRSPLRDFGQYRPARGASLSGALLRHRLLDFVISFNSHPPKR